MIKHSFKEIFYMQNTNTGIKTDKNQRELVEHGSALFPIACYHDNLNENEVMWHWHEELEAIFITQGSAVVTAGNDTFNVAEGEGIFINASVLHSLRASENSQCRFHSLVFHPRLISGGVGSVFHQKYLEPVLECAGFKCAHLKPDIPWQKLSIDSVEIAWQNCIYKTLGYEFKVRNSLSELVFNLWSHLPVIQKRPDAKVVRDSERIKAMLRFIHTNYSSELNTKLIADSVMISESECLRCFHTTINTTPIQYLKQYRIQQAAHQLVFSNDKISDIASKCGFQDMSYFTKTFKQLKNCVPSEYRTLNSQQQ